MHRSLALVSGALLTAAAVGAPSMELFPAGYIVTDLSADGSVMVGNVIGDGSYETFRWTAETGIERLGRATVPEIGTGAGTPDVSYDGTRVSATILSSDNLGTQGLWSESGGWVETMPPAAPGGIVLDQYYGSAWGLSGDGTTVTGFYWTTGPGSAQPSSWTAANGFLALEDTPGRAGRVNAADYDGDIVVGWEEGAGAVWQPTVWKNGVKTRLFESLGFAEAYGVNADGSIIVGDGYNPAQARTQAAIWRWNGASYDMQFVGSLPGTVPNQGGAWLDCLSDNGALMAGGNRYFQSPGATMDGIVWTPSTGLMKDTDWLASLGLTVPSGWDIRNFNSISADGSTMVGVVVVHGTEVATVIIHLDVCTGDINGDGVVDFADLNILLGNYNTAGGAIPGDIDGDGDVDFADLNELLGAYNTTCS